jgi:hypothetical protein
MIENPLKFIAIYLQDSDAHGFFEHDFLDTAPGQMLLKHFQHFSPFLRCFACLDGAAKLRFWLHFLVDAVDFVWGPGWIDVTTLLSGNLISGISGIS